MKHSMRLGPVNFADVMFPDKDIEKANEARKGGEHPRKSSLTRRKGKLGAHLEEKKTTANSSRGADPPRRQKKIESAVQGCIP